MGCLASSHAPRVVRHAAARVSLLAATAKGKLVVVSDPLAAAAYRTSYLRRGIGGLACGAPVLLLVASMVSAVIAGDRPGAIGSVAMVVAIAIAALNFYLSAVRPLMFRRRNGSLEGYKHISRVPGYRLAGRRCGRGRRFRVRPLCRARADRHRTRCERFGVVPRRHLERLLTLGSARRAWLTQTADSWRRTDTDESGAQVGADLSDGLVQRILWRQLYSHRL